MEWGLTRPHNPAARGELLGATAPWRNRSRTKKNKPTLNTKLRILPAILGFDTDNGGEFLNWHLLNYFARRRHPVGSARGPIAKTTTRASSRRTGRTCASW